MFNKHREKESASETFSTIIEQYIHDDLFLELVLTFHKKVLFDLLKQ